MNDQILIIKVGEGSDTTIKHYFYSNVSAEELKKTCEKIKEKLGYDFLTVCDSKGKLTKDEFYALLNLGYKLPTPGFSDFGKISDDGCFEFNQLEEMTWKSLYLDMFLFLVEHIDPNTKIREVRKYSEINIGGAGLFKDNSEDVINIRT